MRPFDLNKIFGMYFGMTVNSPVFLRAKGLVSGTLMCFPLKDTKRDVITA